MITSETALVDTNVLVYAADGTSPFHQPSKHLRDKGLHGEVSFCIFPQIFSEFFAVITDPRRVANPRTQEDAIVEIEKYLEEEHLLKLYPGPDIVEIMLDPIQNDQDIYYYLLSLFESAGYGLRERVNYDFPCDS